MPLIPFLAKKTLRLIMLLGCVLSFSLFLLHMTPGDPVDAYLGQQQIVTSKEHRENLSKRWQKESSFFEKWTSWSGRLIQGDFGESFVFHTPVIPLIKERFALSFPLLAISWLMASLLGFLGGVVAAIYEGKWPDQLIRWMAFTLTSTPSFWLGLLFMMLWAIAFPIFPLCCAYPVSLSLEEVTLLQRLYHALLPAMTLSLISAAPLIIHTRAKVLVLKEENFFLFSLSQGETLWSSILHYGLKNILLPLLTLQFASFGELFGGVVIVEQLFSFPGIGQLTVTAGTKGDIPLLLGVLFFSTCFVFTGNLFSDLIAHTLDPRRDIL